MTRPPVIDSWGSASPLKRMALGVIPRAAITLCASPLSAMAMKTVQAACLGVTRQPASSPPSKPARAKRLGPRAFGASVVKTSKAFAPAWACACLHANRTVTGERGRAAPTHRQRAASPCPCQMAPSKACVFLAFSAAQSSSDWNLNVRISHHMELERITDQGALPCRSPEVSLKRDTGHL